MVIDCREAADLLNRFPSDELSAYQAYLRKYKRNEELRNRKRGSKAPVLADRDWQPADLNNKRILVIGENGLGDEILTLGCLADLCAHCKDVVWLCDRKLQPLLSLSFPMVRFITEPPSDSDLDLAIHSWQLIGRFRTSLEEFPWTSSGKFSPYLPCSKSEGESNRKPLVGLAWHSEGGKTGKSCDIDTVPGWAAFFEALGDRAKFVSLQHGEKPEDVHAIHKAIQTVKDLYDIDIYQDPRIDPFTDLCALVAQVASLDYIVSISTTAIHLAGAIGVSGWLLLPDDPLPHWNAGKHLCVWYPTLHPVRHEQPGDWDSGIERVTQDLATRLR